MEKNKVEAEYKALEGGGNPAKVESLQLRLDNAYKQSVLKTQELIKANADNYVSAYVIALNMSADDETTLRAKYELLGTSARATAPGKAIAAMLDRYGKLVEGEVAPNFTLMKPDGNTFTVHGLPAKWKVIHFWAAQQGSSRQVILIWLSFTCNIARKVLKLSVWHWMKVLPCGNRLSDLTG